MATASKKNKEGESLEWQIIRTNIFLDWLLPMHQFISIPLQMQALSLLLRRQNICLSIVSPPHWSLAANSGKPSPALSWVLLYEDTQWTVFHQAGSKSSNSRVICLPRKCSHGIPHQCQHRNLEPRWRQWGNTPSLHDPHRSLFKHHWYLVFCSVG